MTEEELKQILERHEHWLQKDCDRWEEMKANLSGANLSGANLRGANLRGANLRCAELRHADLSNANLSNANLRDANLNCANLRDADLRDADLKYVNLSDADLSNANLRDADLRHANLRDANLIGAKNVPYVPMVCPDEGAFIGWKKVGRQKIIKLHIPEDALRSSATTRKCRCSKAEVVEIYNLNGTIATQRCIKSDWDNNFIYRVGETVSVDNFDKDRWNECSSGIHFFINRQEAVEYGLS